MKYQISILFLCFSCTVLAQDSRTNDRLKLGTEISTTFSVLDENGITPFLTLKKKRHQFAIGPRFVYSSFDDYEIRNKDNQVYTIDANYRYYASSQPTKIRPYIQFSLEYQYGRKYGESFYDSESPNQTTIGQSFPNSFNLGIESTRHYLNMYTNLGFELALSEHVFIANSIGLGLQTAQKTSRYTDVDQGEIVYRSATNLSVQKGIGWMVNVGLGFRF
jgi:hypothetical protein|tara:strand:- start:33513 stop:34169 length:657 start_codon:yes stop_codon:yes gene_type:complete